jgi:hypothetical protein
MKLSDIRLNRRDALRGALAGAAGFGAGFGAHYLLTRGEPRDEGERQYKKIAGKVDSHVDAFAQSEFEINFRVPDNIDTQVLKETWKILSEIREVNRPLVDSAKNLDVLVLPDGKVDVNYGPLGGVTFLERSRKPVNSAGTLASVLGVVRALDIGGPFLSRWGDTTNDEGFKYDIDVTKTKSGLRWKENRYNSLEFKGVFPEPKASILSEGRVRLPLQQVGQIIGRIYDNQALYADSREAYDCYLKLFKLAVEYKLLNKADYAHAKKLLQPFDVVVPGN